MDAQRIQQRRQGAKMQPLTTRSWRRIRAVLTPATRIVFPPVPRAKNDYATHLPVLIGLAQIRRVERVLEFGCGHYSTKTFLNPAVFPQLTKLESVENDPKWGARVRDEVKHDSRCAVNVVTGTMCEAVSTFDLELFDLILVDDSTNSEQRAATIRAISLRKPERPWTVIHDYEVEEYRRAASGFKQRFAFKAYNPQTGVAFNLPTPRINELKALAQTLKDNSSLFEPDDLTGWVHALRK